MLSYPSKALLEIKDLVIFFGAQTKERLRIVDNISFDIKSSEVIGIVGESGCGKSLTAFSILGILPEKCFAEGQVIFKGKNLLSLEEANMEKIRGRDIGMIFQEPMTSLNPTLTIGYQISEVLLCHQDISKKEAHNKTIELLKAVKIPNPESRIKNYPHLLSGGMRQRVMIAIAIACNPSLLIADEPTTALDVTIQSQILGLLQDLRGQNKMSVMLITHDLGIVSHQTDKVFIMYAGKIMESANTEVLFSNPLHPYTIGLLNSLPSKKGKSLIPIKGVIPSYNCLPNGCRFSDRCLIADEGCKIDEPEMKEISKEHLVRCLKVG